MVTKERGGGSDGDRSFGRGAAGTAGQGAANRGAGGVAAAGGGARDGAGAAGPASVERSHQGFWPGGGPGGAGLSGDRVRHVGDQTGPRKRYPRPLGDRSRGTGTAYNDGTW